MKSENAWVVFDADNTLWKTETLYDEARHAFARFIVETYHRARPNLPKDEDIDEGLVNCAQRIRDKALSKTYGYSACRYARSFEDTLLFFMPDAQHADVIHVRKMALDVFEKKAEPMDGAETAVDALQHEYRLAIITAGERWGLCLIVGGNSFSA